MGNSGRQTGRGPGSSWSHPVALSAVRARLPPHPLPSRGQVLCSSGSLGSSHLQGWLPAARTGLFWAQPLVVQPGKARGLTPGITLNQGGVGLVDVSTFRGCCNTILSAGWREHPRAKRGLPPCAPQREEMDSREPGPRTFSGLAERK